MSNVLFKNKEMIIFNKCKNYVNNNYLVQLLRLYYQETTLYIGPVSTTHKSSEKGSFDILINIDQLESLITKFGLPPPPPTTHRNSLCCCCSLYCAKTTFRALLCIFKQIIYNIVMHPLAA